MGFFYYSVNPDWRRKTCLGIVGFLLKYMYVFFSRTVTIYRSNFFHKKVLIIQFQIWSKPVRQSNYTGYIFPDITIGCFDEFITGCALLFLSLRLRKLRFDDISLLHCCTASLQRSAEVAWIFKFWIINFWRI